MSTSFDMFLPEVLPYVPDCPEIVAINAIRNACIEFCDKSLYWLYTPPAIDILADTAVYTPTLPSSTSMVAVLDAWYDNLPLTPAGEDTVKRVYPLNWPEMQGSPKYLIQQNPTDITLVPYPLIPLTAGLTLIVALKPTRSSTTVDDAIYNNWAEAIGFGARARIHALPNQSFSDPASAMKYDAMFRTQIGKATVVRNRGMTRAVPRVRPPRFY